MQQPNKRVSDRRPVLARKHLPGQRVERLGVLAEVRDIKHCFGVGQLEARKVGVDAGVWRAEIGDSSRRTDASTSLLPCQRLVSIVSSIATLQTYHHDYLAVLLLSDVLHDAIDAAFLQRRRRDTIVYHLGGFCPHFTGLLSFFVFPLVWLYVSISIYSMIPVDISGG